MKERETVTTKTTTTMKVMDCPHLILVPEHYREDGTCRCDDHEHQIMADWGYTWNAGVQRWT